MSNDTDRNDAKVLLEVKEFTAKDPNWVSQEEREAFAKLLSHPKGAELCNTGIFKDNEQTQYKFLFARKLDVDRTVTLMEKHLELRDRLGHPELLTIDKLQPDIRECGMFFNVKKPDKFGRAVCYIFPAKCPLDNLTEDVLLKYMLFNLDNMLQTVSLEMFRMGFTFAENLSDLGFRHLKLYRIIFKVEKYTQSCFPYRFRKILIVNPGFLLRILLRMAKFAGINRKLISRVIPVAEDELEEHVDNENLPSVYGGEVEFDYNAWVEGEMEKLELKNDAHNVAEETE
eukprot:36654_1